MYIEVCLALVSHFHDGGWRGYNRQTAVLAYPIDVTMAVHYNCTVGKSPETTNEPTPIDESRADTLGQRFCALGVFYNMVMERHDPIGSGVETSDDVDRACSVDTNPSALVKEKCASTFEFSRIIPSPFSVSGGLDHRKTGRPHFRE